MKNTPPHARHLPIQRWRFALTVILFLLTVATSLLWAQRPRGAGFGPAGERGGGRGFDRGFDRGGEPGLGRGFGRGPSSTPNRADYPTWELPQNFRRDVFTFVRIQYDSWGGRNGRS